MRYFLESSIDYFVIFHILVVTKAKALFWEEGHEQ